MLLLVPGEGVRDDALCMQRSEVARLLELQLGLDPDEAFARAKDGLTAALKAAEPVWLQLES